MSDNPKDSKDGHPVPDQEPKAKPGMDPEKLLLVMMQAMDRLQTSNKLAANGAEALAAELGLTKAEFTAALQNMREQMASFRINGQQLEDGTVECILDGVPIRVDPTTDIAVGAKQIERQKAGN